MGVLLNLTKEYFHEVGRAEEATVLRVDFTDKNGVFHKKGYRVDGGSPEDKVKKLIELIKQLIEERGTECDLNDIDVSNITRMNYVEKTGYYTTHNGVFQNSDFNGDISGWDVSNVKDMGYMFYYAEKFNQDIGNWDVRKVNNMGGMFFDAENFNQPLDGWSDKLGNVEDMSAMFHGAESFNQDIGNWNVSGVKDMSYMFRYAENFNKPLDGWGDKLGNVEDMRYMFYDAKSFNQPIGNWDVSGVKNMSHMFCGTKKFNQNLSDWKLKDDCKTDFIFDYHCSIQKDNKPKKLKE